MKSAILAVVVAAGVGGFASSSYAQDVKKLQQHPAAAADSSLQHGRVNLPTTTDSHLGEAGAASEHSLGHHDIDDCLRATLDTRLAIGVGHAGSSLLQRLGKLAPSWKANSCPDH